MSQCLRVINKAANKPSRLKAGHSPYMLLGVDTTSQTPEEAGFVGAE